MSIEEALGLIQVLRFQQEITSNALDKFTSACASNIVANIISYDCSRGCTDNNDGELQVSISSSREWGKQNDYLTRNRYTSTLYEDEKCYRWISNGMDYLL